MLRILCATLLAAMLAACSTDQVTLIKPETGEQVKCGPYLTGGWDGGRRSATLERGCIEDFQAQGYQRVSR